MLGDSVKLNSILKDSILRALFQTETDWESGRIHCSRIESSVKSSEVHNPQGLNPCTSCTCLQGCINFKKSKSCEVSTCRGLFVTGLNPAEVTFLGWDSAIKNSESHENRVFRIMFYRIESSTQSSSQTTSQVSPVNSTWIQSFRISFQTCFESCELDSQYKKTESRNNYSRIESSETESQQRNPASLTSKLYQLLVQATDQTYMASLSFPL